MIFRAGLPLKRPKEAPRLLFLCANRSSTGKLGVHKVGKV